MEDSMHILVINCGSSSIKAAVINHETGARALELEPRLGEERGGRPGAAPPRGRSIQTDRPRGIVDLESARSLEQIA